MRKITLEPHRCRCTDKKEGVREVVSFTVNASYCGDFTPNFVLTVNRSVKNKMPLS